ncbi:MAG: hypothetical protein Q3976_07290 [Corynebacterium sp.]|nr:hypothetical protein [Corynebacterium sp.]
MALRAQEAQIAQLRAKLATFERASEPLPTPEALRMVLPQRSFMRGATVTTTVCPTLISYLLAHFNAHNLYSAVVGWPELSYASLVSEGIPNIVAIPDPSTHPEAVIGMLEGFDCIIWHAPALRMTPTQARPLLAKMRRQQTLLLAVGAQLPAYAHLDAAVTGIRGLGQGSGRIQKIEITVRGNHQSCVVQLPCNT